MTNETRKVRTVKSGPDVRYIETKIEYRAHVAPKDGSIGMISGYAAIFDSFSQDLGGFREKIRHGTFKRAVDEPQDVRGLADHEPARILGRTKSGTMRIWEDDIGLAYEISVPDTQAGRDIITSISRGDVSGSSFSFDVVDDDWGTDDDGEIRELRDVDLFDVGPVAFPAYLATVTEATRRSLRNHMRPNLERFRTRLDTAKRYAVVSKDN